MTNHVGFEGQPRYVESIKVVRAIKERNANDGMTKSQKIVFDALKKTSKPISAREMSHKTGLSKTYCNTTLTGFFRDGLLVRRKERVALTMQFTYRIK